MLFIWLALLIMPTYCVFYMCKCSKELNKYNPVIADRTGVIKYMALCFITCGIYGTYFGYKISDEVCEVGKSFSVKTKVKGWLGLLLMSTSSVSSVINFILSKVIPEGSEGILLVLVGAVQGLFDIIGLIGPTLFFILLHSDMNKIRQAAGKDISAVTLNNMNSAVMKSKRVDTTGIAATAGTHVGKNIAQSKNMQIREEANREIVDTLRSQGVTSEHTASLTEMAQQLNNGPIREIPQQQPIPQITQQN